MRDDFYRQIYRQKSLLESRRNMQVRLKHMTTQTVSDLSSRRLLLTFSSLRRVQRIDK
jgi:hypothetical protein